jgi:hypothetical protein
MAHRPTPAWERILRKMALNLAVGFNNIFGSAGAVIYKPPEPTPERQGAPPPDDLTHTFSPTPNNLPPRERRGRD